jgi:hypothetical protein
MNGIDLRTVEIAARTEAMLTDNMRQEIITTDVDTLAEQAAATLKRLLPQKSETDETVEIESKTQS